MAANVPPLDPDLAAGQPTTCPPLAAGAQEAGEADAFLADLYRQVREGEEDAALKAIYHHLYRLWQEGQVGLCERILEEVDVGALPPVLLIGFLTVTAPLKERLRTREAFYQRARERVEVVRGSEPERLLVGLE
jgi:hypothetical protein